MAEGRMKVEPTVSPQQRYKVGTTRLLGKHDWSNALLVTIIRIASMCHEQTEAIFTIVATYSEMQSSIAPFIFHRNVRAMLQQKARHARITYLNS